VKEEKVATAIAPEPRKVEVPRAQIGDIVLFRISSETLRPLLVHTVFEDGTIGGELFVNYEADRVSAYVVKHCFYLPSAEERTVPIKKASPGDAIGEWQPRRGKR